MLSPPAPFPASLRIVPIEQDQPIFRKINRPRIHPPEISHFTQRSKFLSVKSRASQFSAPPHPGAAGLGSSSHFNDHSPQAASLEKQNQGGVEEGRRHTRTGLGWPPKKATSRSPISAADRREPGSPPSMWKGGSKELKIPLGFAQTPWANEENLATAGN